jgi:hypothetical protein
LAHEGFIIPTPGNTFDLRAVPHHICKLCAGVPAHEIAFVPIYGRHMMVSLNDNDLL